MQISVIARKTSPLCYLPNGKFVYYRKGKIYVYNNDKVERNISVITCWKEKILGKFKLAYRFLRLGIRTSIALNDEIVIISIGNYLYEVNLYSEMMSTGYKLDEHVRPLFFSEIKGIEGFEDGIYFGSYVGDLAKIPMHIYKREAENKWTVVYTFPDNAIDHVHNIIPDPYRQCLWIMTGDFGEAAALWKAEYGFSKVERALSGNQKYRGCVGFALPEGLLYATDTPLDDNYIQLLRQDNTIEKILPIDGSCIYGCQWGKDFVFESTVEPNGIYKNQIDFLLKWKKGPGIKNNYTHLYVGNPADGFKVVYKLRKDWLPFCFKFAAFLFPAGENKTDTLYLQPIATDKHDLSLLKITREN